MYTLFAYYFLLHTGSVSINYQANTGADPDSRKTQSFDNDNDDGDNYQLNILHASKYIVLFDSHHNSVG